MTIDVYGRSRRRPACSFLVLRFQIITGPSALFHQGVCYYVYFTEICNQLRGPNTYLLFTSVRASCSRVKLLLDLALYGWSLCFLFSFHVLFYLNMLGLWSSRALYFVYCLPSVHVFVFLCKCLQLVQEIRLRFVIVNWFKAPVAVFAEVSKVVFLLHLFVFGGTSVLFSFVIVCSSSLVNICSAFFLLVPIGDCAS